MDIGQNFFFLISVMTKTWYSRWGLNTLLRLTIWKRLDDLTNIFSLLVLIRFLWKTPLVTVLKC